MRVRISPYDRQIVWVDMSSVPRVGDYISPEVWGDHPKSSHPKTGSLAQKVKRVDWSPEFVSLLLEPIE